MLLQNFVWEFLFSEFKKSFCFTLTFLEGLQCSEFHLGSFSNRIFRILFLQFSIKCIHPFILNSNESLSGCSLIDSLANQPMTALLCPLCSEPTGVRRGRGLWPPTGSLWRCPSLVTGRGSCTPASSSWAPWRTHTPSTTVCVCVLKYFVLFCTRLDCTYSWYSQVHLESEALMAIFLFNLYIHPLTVYLSSISWHNQHCNQCVWASVLAHISLLAC